MQAGMGITDGIIQGKISCFRNKFHKHKEKCSEKRKFLGALCLRSDINIYIYLYKELLRKTASEGFCVFLKSYALVGMGTCVRF